MLAYDFLKKTNRITEDAAGEEYFTLLKNTLEGLNDTGLSAELTELWFTLQLLKITGRAPNLKTDTEGQRLVPDQHYMFDFENMAFLVQKDAPFTANHIKLLRLAYSTDTATTLKAIKHTEGVVPDVLDIVKKISTEIV
jgi:recombinational DNA repair protein (RecF pathway)